MKKISFIIILLTIVYMIKAQVDFSVTNIILPMPTDTLEIDPFSHTCGFVRDLELNCLDKEFAQIENNIWRQKIFIMSEEAKEIKVIFQKFVLSPNAIVSFYTDSLQYQYQGEYFAHKPDSSYISHFLYGDHCTIVIEIPLEELENNQITISQVYHFTESFYESLRADYSCMKDVSCPEGNNWCDEKRSVAIYYFPKNNGRIGQCTGALVNNFRDNYAQYFLTARHCTDDVSNWSNTEFYFNYQNTFCNSEDRYAFDNYFDNYKVQGSKLIGYCDVSWSDNALLLITEPIPIQFNVFYAGVDIKKKKMGNKVTCIHHSKGKPKRIVSGKLKHFAGPKWEMYWDNGITAGGGSGAPVFFNNNKRVIGTISGGFGLDCSNSLKQDWVGKIRACVDYSSNINNALFGTDPHHILYYGLDPIKECQPKLNLFGDFHSTHEYDAALDGLTIQADNTITVSNAIFHKKANYTLTAGDKIVFLPGTRIIEGANVTAKISLCSKNLEFCGVHSSIFRVVEDSSQEFNNDDDDDIDMENERNNYKISIYSNPNFGTFQIETNFPISDIDNLKITNLLGVPVYESQNITSNTIQLPKSVPGLHFVIVFLKDGTVLTQKMMIQK